MPPATQFSQDTRACGVPVSLDDEALHVAFSHTLDSFYIASAGVAPDMMFVKTLPPFDFPDFYYPGYICEPNGFD